MLTESDRTSARRWGLRALSAAFVAAVLLSARPSPGTVAEQRERLPAAAECEDDLIVGHWRAHQHYPDVRGWTEFTLVIERVPESATQLRGKIYNHSWPGGPGREQPGKCDAEQRYRLRVAMEAEGTIVHDVVKFGGTSWKIDELICGAMPGGWYYNLDVFTGKVDRARQEFQSVNNDGGRMVNHPTVFRRIKCLDEGPKPSVEIKPPPIFPENASGCACSTAVGR